MPLLHWLKSLFVIRKDNPELMRVQLHALSRHVPLMYFVLVTNTLALAITHAPYAPPALTILVPGVLIALSLLRLIKWWRTRGEVVSPEMAYRRLRGSVFFAVILGIGFTACAISLYAYGDDAARAHVAFFISITVISCIFCLTTLRPAALALVMVVVVPAVIFFATTGNLVFIAMALNLLLVCCALTIVLFYNFEHLTNAVLAQQKLSASNAEMQALSAENIRLANSDSRLTGLPNRRHFYAELDAALAQRRETGAAVFVGIVDLDGFKPVNDLYGQSVGDAVLVEAGRRLTALSSPTTFLCRLGSDEFAYILRGERSEEDVRAYGRLICDSLAEPYVLADLVVRLSSSVGFASAADIGSDTLLDAAYHALFAAKSTGPGTIQLFTPELQTRLRHSNLVEQGLRHPDLPNQLSLNYQPIFDAQAGRPVGFEALARWASPTLGSVPPDIFIRAAERTGLITRITETLLARALDELKTWPADLRLSFNLSVHDIASPEAVARIVRLVRASGVAPKRIDFEITETAVMRDFEQSRAALTELRALGCSIALDDFGSGYSSLSNVHRLPLDKLKIDRGFIAELEARDASRAILRTMLDLCRNLKLECVVEGAETAGQVAILTQLGCRFLQGYFISRPMPVDAIPAFLKLHTAGRRAG
ncbi:MAG TPA: EAL domain-containing protein [Devosia sp.]